MRIKRLNQPAHIRQHDVMQRLKIGNDGPLVDDEVPPEIASKLSNINNGYFLITDGHMTRVVCRHNGRFIKAYSDPENNIQINLWKDDFYKASFRRLSVHEISLLEDLRKANLSTKEQDTLCIFNTSMRRNKREMLKIRKRFLTFKKAKEPV